MFHGCMRGTPHTAGTLASVLSGRASPTLSAVSLGGPLNPGPRGTLVPWRPPFSWFFISGSFRTFLFACGSRLAAQPPAQSGVFLSGLWGPPCAPTLRLPGAPPLQPCALRARLLGTAPRGPRLLWGFPCAAACEPLGLLLLPDRPFSVTSASPCSVGNSVLCPRLSHFRFYPNAWCWLVYVKEKGLKCRRGGSWLGLSAGSFRVGAPGVLWAWEHGVPPLGPRGPCRHPLACVSPPPHLRCAHRVGLCVSVEPAFAWMFTVGLPVGLDF